MRILIIPSLDARKKLESAPDFRMAMGVARGFVELGDYVYLVAPDKEKYRQGWSYDEGKILASIGNRKSEIVTIPMLKDQWQEVLFTPELLDIVVQGRCKKASYDAIVNCNVGSTIAVKKLRSSGFGIYDVDVPVLNYSLDLKVRTKGKTHVMTDEAEASEVFNYAFGVPMFTLPIEMENFKSRAVKYLSFSLMKKVEKDGVVVKFPILADRFNEIRKTRRESDGKEVVFFYGGRLASAAKSAKGAKRLDKVLELVGRLYSAAMPVRLLVTTPEDENDFSRELFSGKSFVDVKYGQDSEGYVKYLAEADVFLCFSEIDSAGITFWEMMAAGLIGVFKFSPWLKDMLPRGYPYVAESWDSVFDLMVHIVKNWEKVRRDYVFDEKWFESSFGCKSVASRMKSALVERVFERGLASPKFLMELVDRLEAKQYSMKELCEELTAVSDKGAQFGTGKSMIHDFAVRQAVLESGRFIDSCEKEVRFVPV